MDRRLFSFWWFRHDHDTLVFALQFFHVEFDFQRGDNLSVDLVGDDLRMFYHYFVNTHVVLY